MDTAALLEERKQRSIPLIMDAVPEIVPVMLSTATPTGSPLAGCVNHAQVVPQQVKGQGRGLVASKPIRAGEQILAVPENLILFPQAAAAGGTPTCQQQA